MKSKTYSLSSQFRECVHNDTKDYIQSNGDDYYEEWEIKY